ncbi:MAG TPA: GDSL-type esterase/lipase family protein, partial [Rariglobus sp.]
MSPVRSGFLLLSSLLVINSTQAAPSFSDFDQRAHKGERLSVVFFGGSLTWGAQATDPQLTSYRALTSRKLEETYPDAHFRFWDAAIGGTGSQLGAFRLERDVLSRKPDLVFLDFTINDNPYAEPDPDRLAAYEAIVRRLVSSGIPVVQAIFAAKKDVLPNPPPRPLDAAHRAIAAAYGLP